MQFDPARFPEVLPAEECSCLFVLGKQTCSPAHANARKLHFFSGPINFSPLKFLEGYSPPPNPTPRKSSLFYFTITSVVMSSVLLTSLPMSLIFESLYSDPFFWLKLFSPAVWPWTFNYGCIFCYLLCAKKCLLYFNCVEMCHSLCS